MTQHRNPRPDLKRILSGLKDFQRDTVQYVFQRLYQDADQVSRFLIADEVGLGKTLVARGLIASVVDHLWDDVKRIDVVYICSNQEIAQQNIDRLNITQDRTFQHASRATLLPITIQQLKGNKLNFVSLTPGTSFNLSSQGGWVWERVVLYFLLQKAWHVSSSALGNILRGDVRKDLWRRRLVWAKENQKIDRELEKAFIEVVNSQPEFKKRFEVLAGKFGPRRTRLDRDLRYERNRLISDLRRLLARSSLAALQPDLIILDEFQRFKYLLDEDNEFAILAQELFNYKDHTGRPAKVLLMSATPYKMYTMQDEAENHFEDFLRTVNFLANGKTNEVERLKELIDQYRKIFLQWNNNSSDHQRLQDTKQGIEAILRKVMVRTERLAASADRNGMLVEFQNSENNLEANDLVAFTHLDHLAQLLEVENQVEYWKSSAYPLNLMENYKLKRQFHKAVAEATHPDLYSLLEQSQHHLLNWDDIQKYKHIDPGNARLRTLIDQSIESENWKLLWLPANLPYYRPEGPYTNVSENGLTKTLVFSSWQIVPKMIAMLLSYEAERKIISLDERNFAYEEFPKQRPPLLRFAVSRGRLTGLSIFTLIYPCLTLAQEFDPLNLSVQNNTDDSLISSASLLETVKLRIRGLLHEATKSLSIVDTGPVDESWYWYAPVILDRHFHKKEMERWLSNTDKSQSWESMLKVNSDGEDESAFADHVKDLADAFTTIPNMGRLPEDLPEVLAKIALAGPAVTALRSLLRVAKTKSITPEFLAAAAQASLGFRSLFNQPDTIALLQFLSRDYPERDQVYWRTILTYCLHGNLQAVLDEYVHILRESLGLIDHEPREAAQKLGNTLRQALSLRSPSLRFDEIKTENSARAVTLHEHSIRCRYALRYGADKLNTLDDGTRDTDVRVAFNSPFRPFVLATTSVGQEGLDFHQYCHKVVHWNLPSNPVDLEQREGRVHRFKGHVIRRNLTHHYSLVSLKPFIPGLIDPWEKLFDLAHSDRTTSSDLEPYWIYDKGPHRIERVLPVLPLSREIDRIKELKSALVAYRSVIGQPRQQELMDILRSRISEDDLLKITQIFSINLNPPRSK